MAKSIKHTDIINRCDALQHTSTIDLPRRRLVQFMSSIPLLPLAGMSGIAGLLTACGGGGGGTGTAPTVGVAPVTPPAPAVSTATSLTMSGPDTGIVGMASAQYTVALSPTGGTVASPVTVTPIDSGGGGKFSPSSIVLSTTTQSAVFTYTPTSVGAKSVSISNTGGLTNPAALAYTATASTQTTLLVRAKSGSAAVTIIPVTGAPTDTVYTITSAQGAVIDYAAGTSALNRVVGNMVDGTAYTLVASSTNAATGAGPASAGVSVTPVSTKTTKILSTDVVVVIQTASSSDTQLILVDPLRARSVFKAPATNTSPLQLAPSSATNNGQYNFNELYTLAPGQELEVTGDTRRWMVRIPAGSAVFNQKIIREQEGSLS